MTVVAKRRGQTPARNILGRRERFDAVSFFCGIQYDFGLGYIVHAERFDRAALCGSLEQWDYSVTCQRVARTWPVALKAG